MLTFLYFFSLLGGKTKRGGERKGKERERERERQTDMKPGKQTDRQRDRQAFRETDRELGGSGRSKCGRVISLALSGITCCIFQYAGNVWCHLIFVSIS